MITGINHLLQTFPLKDKLPSAEKRMVCSLIDVIGFLEFCQAEIFDGDIQVEKRIPIGTDI